MPREEIVDLALGMTVYDTGEDIGEVGLGIDAVEFAGLDQRCDDGPMFAAPVGAGEERIFTIQGNGTDAALDDVGVDLDAAIVEEPGEALPA